MKVFNTFIPKILVLIFLLIVINCENNATVNSTNSSFVTLNSTNANATVNGTINFNDLSNDCYENDSTSICILKPTCCHITNAYKQYQYSACVDISNPKYAQDFCLGFYNNTRKAGYMANECVCRDYKHLDGSYFKISMIVSLLALFTLVF